jgi:hypothetical protein
LRLSDASANALNLPYGRNAVRLVTLVYSCGWKARADRVSPHFTTRLENLPVASLTEEGEW